MKMMHPYSYVGCKNFAFQPNKLTTTMKEDLVENIVLRVAKFYGVEKKDILGRSRVEEIMIARHISIYLCLQLTGISLVKLGKIFGKDHSTCIHSRDFIQSQLTNKSDDTIKNDIRQLKIIL